MMLSVPRYVDTLENKGQTGYAWPVVFYRNVQL